MKSRHLLRTAILALVVMMGGSVWAQTTTTYDFEDGQKLFSADSRISANVVSGTQSIYSKSFTIDGKAIYFTGASNAQNGYCFAHFDFSSLTDNAARVKVEWDCVLGNGARSRFTIGDASVRGNTGGSSKTKYNNTGAIFMVGTEKSVGYVNGANAGAYLTQLTQKWLHVTVDVDEKAKTYSYIIFDKEGNTTLFSGNDVAFFNSNAVNCTQIDLFGYINNSQMALIDNLSITVTQDVRPQAEYTVKFVDGMGNEVKSDTRTGAIGDPASLLPTDKDSFFNSDETVRYIYVSDDAEGKTVAEDGSTVVTLTFREAETWSYSVKAVEGTTELATIATGTVFEGMAASYGYPQYIAVNGVLYQSTKQGSNPWWGKSFTPAADGETQTIAYTKQDTETIVFCSEGENIETLTPVTGGNTDIRASNRAGGYAATDAVITTLPAGMYRLYAATYGNAGATFNFMAGEQTVLSLSTNGNPVHTASEVFELEEATDIVVPQAGSAGSSPKTIDYVIVERLFSPKYAIENAGFDLCEAATASLATSGSALGADYESTGWKLAGSAAWCNAAAIAYGSDVQNNGVSIPATDNTGNTGNALAVTVGWSGQVTYRSSEPIVMPAGTYTLMAYAYNGNTGAQQFASKLGFVATNGTEYLSQVNSFLSGKWNIDYVTFTLTEPTEGRFQVGGTAVSGGSGSNAKLFIDNLQLTDAEGLAAAQAELDRTNATIDLIAEIVVAENLLANEKKTEGRSEMAAAIADARTAQQTAADAAAVADAIATLKAAEQEFIRVNMPVQEGVYYVYNPLTKKFLSRGANWGTHAVVDDYGFPINVTAENAPEGIYVLSNVDGIGRYGDTYWLYSDANSADRQRTYAIEKTEGGFYLRNSGLEAPGNRVYVYMNDDADKFKVAGNAVMGDNISDEQQTVWQFLTADERDAIIFEREAEALQATLEIAGYSVEDEVEAQPTQTLTFANGHNWAQTVVRTQGGQPITNEYGTEMWQATGYYTQTVTDLPAGIYHVTIQAFYRDGNNANVSRLTNEGYNLSVAYLEANGNKAQVKSWGVDRADDANPNNPAQASALFAQGKYLSETLAAVGEDGTLNLTVANPAHNGDSWFFVGNVTYTHLKNITALKAELAELVAEAKGVKQPMNAETKQTLQDAIAAAQAEMTTAQELEQAIADLNEAIVNAKNSALAYTVVPEVSAAINGTNVYTVEAYTLFREKHLAMVKKHNTGTLTDEECAAYRAEVYGTEGQPGTIVTVLLSAWEENENVRVVVPELVGAPLTAPFIIINGSEAKAVMNHVEPGVYDVTAAVATQNTGITFQATGMEEAVAIDGAQLAEQAIVGDDGLLTFTFNVPAGEELALRDLYFELNRQATADKERADELNRAADDLAQAREELQKALDAANALLESADLTKASEQSVTDLNTAIAAAEQLLADETVPEATNAIVALTRETNAAATALRTAAIEVKKSITVGIAAIHADAQAADAYSLQGRKVQTPSRKGLYIVNGKKVVVK